MSKTLACSHIFVLSEDQTTVDLGEYSYSNFHISNNYAKEINGDNFSGTFQIKGIPGNATALVIEYPSTKTKQLFISAEYNIPIDQTFSRSNPNGDCLIYGTIRSSPPVIVCFLGRLSGYEITIIDPYSPKDVVQRMVKEVQVHNKFLSRGARYTNDQKEVIQARTEPKRLNPIIERIKRVAL